MASVDGEVKDRALKKMASELIKKEAFIIEANKKDLEAAARQGG